MCHLHLQLQGNSSVPSVAYSLTGDSGESFICDTSPANSSDRPHCQDAVEEIHCQLDCVNKTSEQCAQNLMPVPLDNFFSTTFIVFFILQLASNLGNSTAMPLVDAITLELVEKDHDKYCKQRVRNCTQSLSFKVPSGLVLAD